MFLAELLEAGMLVCFGLSWPLNAWKAYRARTARGTSWQFLTLICLGYGFGIAAKVALGAINWVLAVYVLNCLFLAANWAIYFRNRRLDAETVCVCEPAASAAAASVPAASLARSAKSVA